MPDGADLEHHHADGVGDDVVELPRDARALLGHGDPGRGVPLPLGLPTPARSAASACSELSRIAKPASQLTAY